MSLTPGALRAALALLLALAAACSGGGAADAPRPAGDAPTAPSASSTPPPLLQLTAPAGPMARIAVGDAHSCGLRTDGSIACWGLMREGWPDGGGWTAVTSGTNFSCGLRGDGAVACWGDGSHGKTDPPDGRFVQVAAGKQHACALDADGAAACWGWDAQGRASPPGGAVFTAIDVGDTHSCGLTAAGDLLCWGAGGAQSRSAAGPFRALATGMRQTCALRDDGAAFCQSAGVLDGEANPPDGAFAGISAGDQRTCGITSSGALSCWGADPLPEPQGAFASVSVGGWEACAVRTDGRFECWPFAWPHTGLRLDGGGKYALGGRFLDQPVELFPWPEGGLAVADRGGAVDVYASDDAEPRRVLDLTGRTWCCGTEHGMFSAAPDPEFGAFPYLYVYYHVGPDAGGDDAIRGRLARFPIAGGQAVHAEELVILDLLPAGANHFGGAVRFGPDGMLYLSLGEFADIPAGGAPGLGGTIVRIDVRGATAERPYRVPADNPFASGAGRAPEVWAYGFRNPWRMSFDGEGRLWVGDVGEDALEEVSIAEAGADLGWPRFEGNLCRVSGGACTPDPPVTLPLTTYPHADGNCAIVGGITLPGPDGRYVFGDFCSGRVWALNGDAGRGWWMEELLDLQWPLSSFGRGRGGEVYALTFGGPLVRVDAASPPAP